MSTPPRPGTITWQDLTVPDAEALRDFYASVVGWKAQPVRMGTREA
jgi:predicted enzyme related to lactoylglutathione lyase